MPGMWELPEIPVASAPVKGGMTLRHSITVTDYVVHVARNARHGEAGGKWIENQRVARLPLTGLARKILKRAEII